MWVAFGYLIANYVLDWPGDLIAGLLSSFQALRFSDYPNFNFPTLVVYLAYAMLGTLTGIVMAAIIKNSKANETRGYLFSARNIPSFIIVSIIISFLLLGELSFQSFPSIATHILAFEGDSHVEWFEGNFQDYEKDKMRRLGQDSIIPHRLKYKKFSR